MILVYKINWFVNKIGRGVRLLAGVLAALIIVWLFLENNKQTQTSNSIDSKIGHVIQRSVDLTSHQFKQFIQTINPIK